jgi:hypothetical protein
VPRRGETRSSSACPALEVVLGLGGRFGQKRVDSGRFPTRDSLTCLAGVAPSTRQSGKVKAVTFRWGADKQLRDALCDFAGDSRHASPWAADLYQKAIARGYDHPHAVRILARAWGPRHLALLARPRPLRPRHPQQPPNAAPPATANRRLTARGLTQGNSRAVPPSGPSRTARRPVPAQLRPYADTAVPERGRPGER